MCPYPYVPPPERGIFVCKKFCLASFRPSEARGEIPKSYALKRGDFSTALEMTVQDGSALFYKKVKIALQNLFLFVENVLFFGFTMI